MELALEGWDKTVHYTPEDHADFMDLCDRVNKVLPRSKSFAPWHYYIKAIYIVGSFLAMEIYSHYNNFYSFPLSIVMGFHMALIGEVRFKREISLQYVLILKQVLTFSTMQIMGLSADTIS